MKVENVESNKYEIIAILRDEYRKKTKLEIPLAKENALAEIIIVDSQFIYIYSNKNIESNIVNVIAKSHDGVISFSSEIEQVSSDCDKYNYRLRLPSVLSVLQRRSSPRIQLSKKDMISCCGRYNNGESYFFNVANISIGGCSLLTNKPNEKFLNNGKKLNNARLSFGQKHEITLSLLILDDVKRVVCNNESIKFQFPCQFIFKNKTEKNLVEKIIMDFTLKNKNNKKKYGLYL
ncbi:TPA: hypothetical protein NPP81_003958 [Klebsiella quasipneumoniae subsp. quasipneumoniae]|nr:hypothetical protein [Klebsiella quasipneumoniae subsp. quasipneumoniae]